MVHGLLLSRGVGTPIWNIHKCANQCESICRLAHMILYSDCRSLFWELLDFPGRILSKELNPRIPENVNVIGSFPVFGIVFVGYLETGQMFRF